MPIPARCVLLASALMLLSDVLASAASSSFAPPSEHGDQNQAGNPYKAPIFRDRNEDNTPGAQTSTPETVTQEQVAIVDPAAYLEMKDSTRARLEECNRQPFLSASERATCNYLIAWDKLIQLLKRNGRVLFPESLRPMALRLGSSGSPGEALRSEFTNYAPDSFTNQEIVKLFEINELLRKSGNSAADGMKRVNLRMRRAYIHAVAGVRPMEACASFDERQECQLCQIGLILSKPCVIYPCGHVYHQKCALTSTAKQHESINMCPQCGSYYRVPLVEPEARV